MTNQAYRINGPRVIFENIDGELILVHLEKGTYYSTDEVGAALWSLIEAGCTAAELCGSIQAQYGPGSEEVAAAVSTCLSRLTGRDQASTAASTRVPRPASRFERA